MGEVCQAGRTSDEWKWIDLNTSHKKMQTNLNIKNYQTIWEKYVKREEPNSAQFVQGLSSLEHFDFLDIWMPQYTFLGKNFMQRMKMEEHLE